MTVSTVNSVLERATGNNTTFGANTSEHVFNFYFMPSVRNVFKLTEHTVIVIMVLTTRRTYAVVPYGVVLGVAYRRRICRRRIRDRDTDGRTASGTSARATFLSLSLLLLLLLSVVIVYRC